MPIYPIGISRAKFKKIKSSEDISTIEVGKKDVKSILQLNESTIQVEYISSTTKLIIERDMFDLFIGSNPTPPLSTPLTYPYSVDRYIGYALQTFNEIEMLEVGKDGIESIAMFSQNIILVTNQNGETTRRHRVNSDYYSYFTPPPEEFWFIDSNDDMQDYITVNAHNDGSVSQFPFTIAIEAIPETTYDFTYYYGDNENLTYSISGLTDIDGNYTSVKGLVLDDNAYEQMNEDTKTLEVTVIMTKADGTSTVIKKLTIIDMPYVLGGLVDIYMYPSTICHPIFNNGSLNYTDLAIEDYETPVNGNYENPTRYIYGYNPMCVTHNFVDVATIDFKSYFKNLNGDWIQCSSHTLTSNSDGTYNMEYFGIDDEVFDNAIPNVGTITQYTLDRESYNPITQTSEYKVEFTNTATGQQQTKEFTVSNMFKREFIETGIIDGVQNSLSNSCTSQSYINEVLSTDDIFTLTSRVYLSQGTSGSLVYRTSAGILGVESLQMIINTSNIIEMKDGIEFKVDKSQAEFQNAIVNNEVLITLELLDGAGNILSTTRLNVNAS